MKLVKVICKKADEEVANKPGGYTDFSGNIDFGGNKGKVYQATFTLNKNGSIDWEKGTWEKGIWKNGVWHGGKFHEGTWTDGVWEQGKFYSGGIWKKGTWKSGQFAGTWKNGVWEKGGFYNGTWDKGTWKNGTWNGGKWMGGKWVIGNIYDPYGGLSKGIKMNPADFTKKKKENSNGDIMGFYGF